MAFLSFSRHTPLNTALKWEEDNKCAEKVCFLLWRAYLKSPKEVLTSVVSSVGESHSGGV